MKIGTMMVTVVLVALWSSMAVAVNKEWTFMVYMDGDNNLEQDCLNDFIEMAKVGSDANINIVVQMDRIGGYSTTYGNWTNTRRFLITKGMTPLSTPTQDMGELNMGSAATLSDFVKWGIANYPANRYVVVLWNHGGGWRNALRTRTVARVHKAICWDDTNQGDCLYMKDVQSTLLGCGKKLALVGFDACLMGMVEVASDMRNVADVMVGSEEVEPGAGWPYDKLLARLVANPAISTRDFAAGIVTDYNTYYSTRDSSTTLSAIDLTKIGALNTAISNFVLHTNQWAGIKAAREATRTYSEADGYPYADLGHFMANIATAGVTDPQVLSAATAVRTALTAAVISNKFGSGRTNSTGLAVYFPKTKAVYDSSEGADYPTHDYNAATGWNGLLMKYFTPPADIPVDGGTTPPADADVKLLEYVNSAAVTTAMLDAVPYVSTTAAQRIVAYRATNRIDNVAELDAIAYVTTTMITKLRLAAATWAGGGTTPPPPPADADAKLITYINSPAVTVTMLDAVAYVSTTAANNIVNYRAGNRIDNVAELDAIPYVSVTMIDKLRLAAGVWTP